MGGGIMTVRIRVFGQQKDEHGGTYHLQSPVLNAERAMVNVKSAEVIAEQWRGLWQRNGTAVGIPGDVEVALCEVDEVEGLAGAVIVQTSGFVL